MEGVVGSGFPESSYRWGLKGPEHSHMAAVCGGGKELFIHSLTTSLSHSFTHSHFSSFTLSPFDSLMHLSIPLLTPSLIHSFSTAVLCQAIL